MNDRSQIRIKTIGVRVTESDFHRLEALANAQGKSLGEWCREMLLETTESEKHDSGDRILLSELLALRTILLNVLFSMSNGQSLTREEMADLIRRADAEKLRKAMATFENYGSIQQ